MYSMNFINNFSKINKFQLLYLNSTSLFEWNIYPILYVFKIQVMVYTIASNKKNRKRLISILKKTCGCILQFVSLTS